MQLRVVCPPVLAGVVILVGSICFACVGDEPVTPGSSSGGSTSSGGSSSGGVDGGGDDGSGSSCDASKDPKDTPCLIADAFGAFVAPLGDDGNDGTRAHPVRTIAAGLAAARKRSVSRVFICDGTYAENVALNGDTDGINLLGGFSCTDFSYNGFRPKIAPVSGVALLVDSLSKATRVSDLELVAPDATTPPGSSSIAVFVRGAKGVTFQRARIVAGKGVAGASPTTAPPTNHLAAAQLKGNVPISSTQHVTTGPTCTCPSYGASKGGDGGEPPTSGTATPAVGVANQGVWSAPGNATEGGAGAHGLARQGGVASTTLGVLDAKGWVSTAGGDGLASNPGQGGGGGGAGTAAGVTCGGGGGIAPGSGGCGSCGGAGGKGGGGGGSSIAILVVNTPVVLLESTLVATAGGAGGAGGAGEAAILGGALGTALDKGCPGGQGGTGAGGSGGAGGTGGVSVGILYTQSPPPTIDGAPQANATTLTGVTLGTAGSGGPSGPAGLNAFGGNAGSVGAVGLAGVVRATLSTP